MADQWDDWMPSPCSRCLGIWDLNAMYPDPRRSRRNSSGVPVVCPDCYHELVAEEGQQQ